MSKWTQGERWAVDEDDRPGMEWNRQIVQADNPDNRICFMAHSNRRDGPRDEYRARLIAEAPAMAELLAQFCAPGAAEDGRLRLGEILTRAQALLTTAPSLLSRVKGETT